MTSESADSHQERAGSTGLTYMGRQAGPTLSGEAQVTCRDFSSSWWYQEILLATLSPVLTLLPSSWPFFQARSKSDRGGPAETLVAG